jgi:hypothetical protein
VKCETLKGLTAEQIQGQHRQQCDARRMTVRDKVWLTLISTTDERDSARIAFAFSRTRSKITIVSFTE